MTVTASTELQSTRRLALLGPASALYRTARAQRSRTQPPLLHPMADTPPARVKAALRSDRSGAVGAMALGPVKMGIQDGDCEGGGASSETSQLRPTVHILLLYTHAAQQSAVWRQTARFFGHQGQNHPNTFTRQ